MDREGNRPFPILVVDDETDIEALIEQRMRPRIRSGKYRFLLARFGIKTLVIPLENPSIGNLPGRALARAPSSGGLPALLFQSTELSTATVTAASS